MIIFSRPIILTVAKCWDPSPQGYFTLPRSECTATLFFPSIAKCGSFNIFNVLSTSADEPVRPIDPAAWVSHSVAMTGAYPVFPGSSSLSTITSSSSVTETERESLTPGFPNHFKFRSTKVISSYLLPGFDDFNLSLHSDMASVAKAMASPESGLEVRDRMWLKITIPNAFLGKTAEQK